MRQQVTEKTSKTNSKRFTINSLHNQSVRQTEKKRSRTMKRSKFHATVGTIIISVMVALVFAIPSYAGVYVELFDGNDVDADYIPTEQPVTFNIHVANNSGEPVTGLQHGFKIYSPSGAEWQTPTWSTAAGLDTYFDMISTGGFGVDGMGEDTVYISALAMMTPGMPSGYDDIILTIATQMAASSDGDTLCIDSSFYQPSGSWLWSTSSGSFEPDWGGPYCYEVMNMPLYGSISGTKFHDVNGNSSWESSLGESGVNNYTIRLEGTDDLGAPVSRIEITNGLGEYTFNNVYPGDYKVLEDVKLDWMAQTYPTTVFHTIDDFQLGEVQTDIDFGNDSICEFPTSSAVCESGTKDDFDIPEPAHWSQGPENYLLGIGTYITNFDEPAVNRRFGHTIEYCWDDNCVVMSATLCLRLKATGSYPTTDWLSLGDYSQNNRIWSQSMNSLIGIATNGLDNSWDYGDVMTICLDLADLPASGWLPTNILAALQDGNLDIYIQDDTEVDWIDLSVELCCKDTCYAHGDIDRDGIPLTTADYVFLSEIISNQVTPTPTPLYYGNFNGDGYLNIFDLDIFDDYRAIGMAAFSPYGGYPVLTYCYPILETSGCIGDRGNVDGDPNDMVDISDLTYLVDYLFGGGEAPPYPEEADINGDGNVDISDLTYLVDYLFGGGNPPMPCGTTMPVSSAKLNGTIKLNSTYDGESTRLSVSSPSAIRGVQLELRSSESLTIDNLTADGIDLLQYEQNGIYSIGLIDLHSAAVIGVGDIQLLDIKGQFEIVSALVADDNHNTIVAMLSTDNSKSLPGVFSLDQNYPNPFNPATAISFALPEASHVKLDIFNITGQKVTTLVDERRDAGHHTVSWDASGAASGVYFYRLSGSDFVESKKMLLLK